MYGKCVKLILAIVMAAAVTACEDRKETHKDTVEDRLLYSFRAESPALQAHVAEIVQEARALRYPSAMNKLALLSATQPLTEKQKVAVDLMIRQLRFDMEEEIFSKQDKQE